MKQINNSNIMDDSLISKPSSFTLSGEITPEHYQRSEWIRSLEPGMITNNSIALAIRTALQASNIPHEQVYAVIDSLDAGTYFKVYAYPFKGGSWLFQAIYPSNTTTDELLLLAALDRRRALRFDLEFCCVGKCISPTYMPKWRKLVLAIAKAALLLVPAKEIGNWFSCAINRSEQSTVSLNRCQSSD